MFTIYSIHHSLMTRTSRYAHTFIDKLFTDTQMPHTSAKRTPAQAVLGLPHQRSWTLYAYIHPNYRHTAPTLTTAGPLRHHLLPSRWYCLISAMGQSS